MLLEPFNLVRSRSRQIRWTSSPPPLPWLSRTSRSLYFAGLPCLQQHGCPVPAYFMGQPPHPCAIAKSFSRVSKTFTYKCRRQYPSIHVDLFVYGTPFCLHTETASRNGPRWPHPIEEFSVYFVVPGPSRHMTTRRVKYQPDPHCTPSSIPFSTDITLMAWSCMPILSTNLILMCYSFWQSDNLNLVSVFPQPSPFHSAMSPQVEIYPAGAVSVGHVRCFDEWPIQRTSAYGEILDQSFTMHDALQ